MIHGQLLLDTVLALAQRGDSPSYRRHMLTDGEVQTLHEGGVDLPAKRHQNLIDGLKRAEQCAVKAAWRNAITPQGIQVPYEPLGLSITGHLVV